MRSLYKMGDSHHQVLFGTLDGLFLQLEEKMQTVQKLDYGAETTENQLCRMKIKVSGICIIVTVLGTILALANQFIGLVYGFRVDRRIAILLGATFTNRSHG